MSKLKIANRIMLIILVCIGVGCTIFLTQPKKNSTDESLHNEKPMITAIVDNGKEYFSKHNAAITISTRNVLTAGTYEMRYDWASATTASLTCDEMTNKTNITIPLGVSEATTNLTITSDGRRGDGTGYLYVCIPTKTSDSNKENRISDTSNQVLSSSIIRTEMYLTTLYGMDRADYNVAYNYGTYGSISDGHSEQYPVYISGTKVTEGNWNVKKPSTIGVRQLHSSTTNAVAITQILSSSQSGYFHDRIKSAIAASGLKGNKTFDYLNPAQLWMNHWTVVHATQRVYSRSYTSKDDVLNDAETGSNFSSFESDYLVTQTGRAYLQSQIKSVINTAGFGTRDAVVAAAKFLAVAFPYDINYVSGFGGSYYNGVTAVPNTQLSKFNHLDGLNIESETTSWGSMDNSIIQTTQNKLENPNKLHGINCSSFIYWAIFNGGFELYNDIANMIAYYGSVESDFIENIIKVTATYLGHGIGGAAVNKQSSFELTGKTGVANSYYPTWNDANKAISNGIQPGDLVVRGTHHIGMVIDVTDEYIYTVDTFEHQNDYALCYNGFTENTVSKDCKERIQANNSNLIHSGLYIKKFARDHSQNRWDKVISMDYVYNNSSFKRTSSPFYEIHQ